MTYSRLQIVSLGYYLFKTKKTLNLILLSQQYGAVHKFCIADGCAFCISVENNAFFYFEEVINIKFNFETLLLAKIRSLYDLLSSDSSNNGFCMGKHIDNLLLYRRKRNYELTSHTIIVIDT